ncbi:MAG TPA: peptidase U34 [Firmicutes bacterium]|nr:peptidase U34 [Bacillota bacterium]
MRKTTRRISTVLLAVMLIVVFQIGASACTDILVGKDATTDGSVITSHTVDGRYDSRILIYPAEDHEPGSMVPVYQNIVYGDRVELIELGQIPQVEHTYKYFHGGYPYANEHQVIIGESTIYGNRATTNSPEAIMTVEQLSAFGLQRAKTAREAIQVMGDLAVTWGFRESCVLGECMTVSDPNEVWVFEVFGVGPFWTKDSGKPGAVWAAQRVPDDHIACVPNFSRIAEIDITDTDHFMVCDNYIDTAVELGLYDPESGKPFVWREAYGMLLPSPRIWQVYNTLQPSGNWKYEDLANYPFSIKPDEKVSVEQVIALFRDVYEGAGAPFDMTDNDAWYYKDRDGNPVLSPLANPQPSADVRNLLGIPGQRTIAVTGCSYYWVSQARSWLPDEIGGVVWFGLDNPHKGVFIPMRVGTERVPESWTVVDRDRYDRTCSYWAFDTVDRVSSQNYGRLMPLVAEVRDSLQNDMFAFHEAIDKVALELWEKDPELAKNFVTDYTYNMMLRCEQEYYDLADRLLFSLPH